MTGLTPNHFPRFTTGLVAVVGILLALGRSQAADINPSILKLKANTFTSQCGQFTVIGHAPGSPLGPPSLSKIRGGYLQMDPALLLLTCEQIKTKLLGLLEGGDEWKGAITGFVQGKALASEPVQVNSQWYPHGWRFQIVVPGQVERKQLIRATVRALLLEMANRHNPTAGLAETPLWLQEGLAAQLFALHGTTLVPGNRTLTIQTETSVDVYREDRDHLRLFRPLDFAALSYPTQRQLTGLAWEKIGRASCRERV